jgi:hypothetical protein
MGIETCFGCKEFHVTYPADGNIHHSMKNFAGAEQYMTATVDTIKTKVIVPWRESFHKSRKKTRVTESHASLHQSQAID